MTGVMTDKQMEVILNLVADKFAGCQSMEDVKQAIKEVREMARSLGQKSECSDFERVF